MSNDEAKFLLNAYRPNGRDAVDPSMAAALEQAKQDPALAAWFNRDQAHAAAVAAKLREIAPPAELRAAILAGSRASEKAWAPRTRWLRPAWLAAAAAIVLTLGAGLWWRLAPIQGATFEEFAVNFVDRGFRLQKHSADVSVLREWLQQQRGPIPESLPSAFSRLRALGCRTLKFEGQDVSLMCFEEGGKEFHVFVARRENVTPVQPFSRRTTKQRGGLASATWNDAHNRYVLVSDAGMDAVNRLL
jgi:hypothetical protein